MLLNGIVRSAFAAPAVILALAPGLAALMSHSPAQAQAIAQQPLFLSASEPPQTMLVLSRDHELYKEAYPDYSDLDGDGRINKTYTDAFSYYGYFDSNTCYSHAGGADDRFIPHSRAGGANGHYCSGNQWSGNFLNWASMTRMDIVRRVLFGGTRSTDTDHLTVLERILIPNDAHAFVKVYSGADLGELTPYGGETAISMCNVTYLASGRSDQVDTAGNPPTLRVAGGEWPVWAASEVRQCAWREEQGNNTAKAWHPSDQDDQLATLSVRIEACRAGLEEQNCRTYPNSNSKPIGLLQQYGEDDLIRFGLLSGSYRGNRSGGVLRKNIGRIVNNTAGLEQEDEIDPATGVFINQAADHPGIINTINRFRLTHWNYGSRRYEDNCSSPGITAFSDGNCSNWGNPVGEMFLEALRYFSAAGNATGLFDVDDSSLRLSGLPRADSWRDPFAAGEYCGGANIVLLSTGSNSFDRDDHASAADIPGLNGTASVRSATNTVGQGEGINGSYISGGADGACTAKTLTGLADAAGICPESPSLDGGFSVAGLAYHGWTQNLRPNAGGLGLNVKTFAVNLAEPLPRLEFGDITIVPACQAHSDGNATALSAGWRACSLIQMDVENADYDSNGKLVAGAFLAYWEDSTFGSDYDMDGVSRLTICKGVACGGGVSGNDVRVTVDAVQGFAGHALRFGYTVTGSTDNGIRYPVLRPGGRNFSVLLTPAVNPGNQPPGNSRVFKPGSSTAGLLRDPLWYAAKWGGFDKEAGTTPAQADQWDTSGNGHPDNYYLARNPGQLEADLSAVFGNILRTTASASSIATNSTRLDTDTVLFQARFNTEKWSGDLLAFRIEADGSATPDPLWSAAAKMDNRAPDSRLVLTVRNPATQGGAEIATEAASFTWDELDQHQRAWLQQTSGTNVISVPLAQQRIAFLRGDRSLERTAQNLAAPFRARDSVLGDIVNSDPQVVGNEDFGYALLGGASDNFDAVVGHGYQAHRQAGKTRTPLIVVGANDGMLHGFNAETGDELFAYVPYGVYQNLFRLTEPGYTHRYYVDGSPRVADAWLGDRWAKVVAGTTGAGGRSVFLLDVTDPDNMSAASVLWEFRHPELGATIGQPSVVPLPNGRFGVVVGSGYGNDSGTGRVFVLDAADGSVIRQFLTTPPTGHTPNDMASPLTVDSSGDRIANRIYAGDTQGYLWRFDMTGNNLNQAGDPAHWGAPAGMSAGLFRALRDGKPQAITSQPEAGRSPDGKMMVFFGTGTYYRNGDNVVSNPVVDSFYGLIDSDNSINGRGALLRQEILRETADHGADLRVVSDHALDAADQGWYLDLLWHPQRGGPGARGERVVSRALLRSGRIIFATLIPSADPCGHGGESWLMEIDAYSGGRLRYSVLDLNADGLFDDGDQVTVIIENAPVRVPVSGRYSGVGIIKTPAIISAGEREYKYTSGSTGRIEVITERGADGHGRQSWRQIR
ncbi:MAG: PilC/PilY family type IV pilus protein [Aquisalimonadaceae bacterium]